MVSANVDIKATPFAGHVVLEQRFVIARSHAQLGRMAEAENEFKDIIAETQRQQHVRKTFECACVPHCELLPHAHCPCISIRAKLLVGNPGVLRSFCAP